MSAGGGAVERAGAKEADHVIAKAVENAGVRDAEKLAGTEAGKTAEKQLLASRLKTATEWGKGKLPLRDGPADGVLFKRSPAGEITNYSEYNGSGEIRKRVDLTGRPHGGIPTPHTVDYTHDASPSGQRFPRGLRVRLATPEEIP
jgi:Bacterial toxin 24